MGKRSNILVLQRQSELTEMVQDSSVVAECEFLKMLILLFPVNCCASILETFKDNYGQLLMINFVI